MPSNNSGPRYAGAPAAAVRPTSSTIHDSTAGSDEVALSNNSIWPVDTDVTIETVGDNVLCVFGLGVSVDNLARS